MAKDKRYGTVKILIDGDHLTYFREIFDTVPKTVVAKDLGIHFDRFKAMIEKVDSFKLAEIYRISNLIGIERMKILQLVDAQYEFDKKSKTRK